MLLTSFQDKGKIRALRAHLHPSKSRDSTDLVLWNLEA